ncbi:MAG: hypothetical protein C4321_11025, partial [Chloroflexota bacterium]
MFRFRRNARTKRPGERESASAKAPGSGTTDEAALERAPLNIQRAERHQSRRQRAVEHETGEGHSRRKRHRVFNEVQETEAGVEAGHEPIRRDKFLDRVVSRRHRDRDQRELRGAVVGDGIVVVVERAVEGHGRRDRNGLRP